jgi:hypothetical protein
MNSNGTIEESRKTPDTNKRRQTYDMRNQGQNAFYSFDRRLLEGSNERRESSGNKFYQDGQPAKSGDRQFRTSMPNASGSKYQVADALYL